LNSSTSCDETQQVTVCYLRMSGSASTVVGGRAESGGGHYLGRRR
jgi:hypothetical protein